MVVGTSTTIALYTHTQHNTYTNLHRLYEYMNMYTIKMFSDLLTVYTSYI